MHDWHGLLACNYNCKTGKLYFEQPQALIVCRGRQELIEMSDEKWCRAVSSTDARSQSVVETPSAVSFVATRQHQMFARVDAKDAEKLVTQSYRKMKCEELLHRMQTDACAVHFLVAEDNEVVDESSLHAANAQLRSFDADCTTWCFDMSHAQNDWNMMGI